MLKKYKNLLLLELKKEDYNIDKFEIINIEEDIDEITADPFYLKKFDKRIIIKKGIKITLKDTPLYFIFYKIIIIILLIILIIISYVLT